MTARASQGVAVSGTLMALFLGLGNSALTNLKATNPDLTLLREGLVIGLILFSIDLLAFLSAYMMGKYRTDPNPSAIVNQLAKLGQADLIRQVTSNLVDATLANDAVNDRRAKRIEFGYYLLGTSVVAVLLFGVGLVFAFSQQ
jgi:hypothetical protein